MLDRPLAAADPVMRPLVLATDLLKICRSQVGRPDRCRPLPRACLQSLLLAGLLLGCSGSRDEAELLRDGMANLQASLLAAGGGAATVAGPSTTGSGATLAPSEWPVAGLGPRLIRAAPSDAAALAARPSQPAGVGPAPRAAAHLLGQTPEHVLANLGEPSLRRPEAGIAEVWLYLARTCALDVVLYRDRGGRLRVGFAAARARGETGETVSEAECLHLLSVAPGGRPQG
jgi:hypothetical protein